MGFLSAAVAGIFLVFLVRLVQGFGDAWFETEMVSSAAAPLMVPLTLIQSAGPQGAVCSDGTLPAYHLDRGYGSGANSWIVNLEGGGWCNDIRSCIYRKKTRRGSSTYMEKEIPFTGIMSNKPDENPDFFNWNRVKLRYCDGASFLGEGQDETAGLYFRGQRIWLAAMENLLAKGLSNADQALLTGCSAGGLAAIQHCDEFRRLFPGSIRVKCLADAGLFLDISDVAGGHTIRTMYEGVVTLQGASQSLPTTCTSQMNATSLQESLAPNKADPNGYWKGCKFNYTKCDADQIKILQGFRDKMLDVVKGFSMSRQNGLFINSCFAHCQSERQDTWYGSNSPLVENKGIANAVSDWYFDRTEEKLIDCPYPCDTTCHNLIFRSS